MSNRTTLGNVLHHAGQLLEAEALFKEAKKIQKVLQPDLTTLYSVQSFRYWNLLLSQYKFKDVLTQAQKALEIENWRAQHNLNDSALIRYALGKAHILQALGQKSKDFSKAADFLCQSLHSLRMSGEQIFTIPCLLARAELNRLNGKYKKAWKDLNEAKEMVERGEVKLYLADCALEAARLYNAQGDKEKAKEEWALGKRLVEETGYGRRKPELEELEKQLGGQ